MQITELDAILKTWLKHIIYGTTRPTYSGDLFVDGKQNPNHNEAGFINMWGWNGVKLKEIMKDHELYTFLVSRCYQIYT